MVGDRLNFLYTCRVGHREFGVYLAQGVDAFVVAFVESQPCQLRQRYAGQRYEILHLNLYAVTDQGVFRKIEVEGFAFRAVAAVDRRDGCKRI